MIDAITLLRAQEAGLPAAESHPDQPLACFPLRVDWERTLPVVPESHGWPAPEKMATVVTEYAGKSAVSDLVRRATALGWDVVVTEARGSWPGVGQRPSRQRASFAVRMSRGLERAVAVYVEGSSPKAPWSWDAMYRWDAETLPVALEGITRLNATLERWLHSV